MRLSASNRGWPFSFDQFIDLASEMGFSGVELYDVQKNEALTSADGLLCRQNITNTTRKLKERHLKVACIDSSIDITGEEDRSEELEMLLEIAYNLRTPYISVCAMHDNDARVRQCLSDLVAQAEKRNVSVLVKTKGIYSDTSRLRALLDDFASDNLAALWDMHHPYRDFKEEPEQTVEHLGAYIKHVHLKDSDDDGNYTLIGEGSLPVDDMMMGLSSVDYDTFISLEWKPVWMEELQDPQVIFPHFVNYMKRFEPKHHSRSLYKNHDGSGQYVWKKDELVDMTFSKVLDTMVQYFPDQYAFKYTTLDYTRTYEQFREDVDDFARALVSMGVGPGCKVSVWATNVPQWFIAFWAVTKIGAVLVSVNTAYKIHEVEYLLRQSDTHTLIMVRSSRDADYGQIMNEICPEIAQNTKGSKLHCKRLPFLRNIITVGFEMPGCLTFEEAMARKSLVPQAEIQNLASMVRPSDVCNMQYTSGTTGFPKGVMLTHYNVINNGKCIGDRMGLSTADRMMLQVPMFHCFGMVLSMTASMTHGSTLCPLPYFSAKNSLACINQEKITCFNGVPTMFIAMFNHPDYRKTDFSHMRTGIMAGAGCPPDLMRKAASPDEMNMRGIVSVYGQTESSPGSTMSSWTDSLDVRCDTVGYAFPHVECKIVDPETGAQLPDGQNGEFCSRGYNTMKGYYKMSKATKETVDDQRWLHSGDLAMRDSDGNFKITGRLKDMIIRGGENIYPKEVEEFIYTHPSVKDVQVIGVPDEKYGEEAAACIILKEGCSADEKEMRNFIAQSIAAHKVPRYIVFMDNFPMNAAGKVLKYKMREDLNERLKEGCL